MRRLPQHPPRNPLRASLYSDQHVSVSSSWVRFGKTSYTTRSILSLEFQKHQTPRRASYPLLVVAGILVCFSLMHLFRGTLPELLAQLALIGSVILFVIAFWLAFISRAHCHIIIKLMDGSTAIHKRHNEQEAYAIHEAITEAMHWQVDYADNADEPLPLITSVIARRNAANS